MKKAISVWMIVVLISVITFIVLAITSNPARANDDNEHSCPVVPPIVNTIYVDKTVTRTIEVPTIKIIKVEVPVYETQTVTNDPKTIRTMMKVTHDRYLALLAMYKALKSKK